MKYFRQIFFVFIVSSFLSSCRKEEKYPIEPVITFKSVDAVSQKLIISFTDGDGDIGLTTADTIGPFSPGSKYFYNCFMTFYRKNGEIFDTLNFDPPYYYRIPVLTPKERNKNIKGDIEINLDGYFVEGNQDTLKVDIYIADRALHESNTVQTSVFILTQ